MDYNPRSIIWDDHWRSKEHEGKRRVLVVGPANPSTGGIPSYIDDSLLSQLRNQFLLGVLDPLMVKTRFKKQRSHFSLKEVKLSLRVLKTFIKVIRKFDPALVHIHTSSYWGFYEKSTLLFIAKIFFNKKVILHIHGGEFDLFYQRSSLKKFIDKIIRWADKTLIVSKKIGEAIGDTHMTVVDNSTRFDDKTLTADKQLLRDKYSIAKKKTVFLSIAILEKRKCIYETIEVFKDILAFRNDFIFIIAGEGPDEERISNFIDMHNLGNNVKIYDYVEGQKKEDIFLLSDVFILNSSNESFGITLVEAVSHGLFVITTPVGIASDAEEIFTNENCIIVPINNNNALRDGILAILNNEIDTENVARKNYFDFKRRFDIDPVFDRLGAIYQEVFESV